MLNRRRKRRLQDGRPPGWFRRKWQAYRLFYNRDGFGSKVLRFVMPAFTRWEVLGLLVAVVALIVILNNPSLLKRFDESTGSKSDTKPTVSSTSEMPAGSSKADAPTPSASTRPPTGLPTTLGPDLPSALLNQQVIRLVHAIYDQTPSLTSNQHRLRLSSLAQKSVLVKLSRLTAPTGFTVRSFPDLANISMQQLDGGKSYVQLPVLLDSTDARGVHTTKGVTSRSVWMSKSGGWQLTWYSDKDSASGR